MTDSSDVQAANARVWDQDQLANLIHQTLRDELLSVGHDFVTSSNLIDAGLDSLAVTQLMLSVEEATGVWVDEGELTPENLENSETLARCVLGHLNNA